MAKRTTAARAPQSKPPPATELVSLYPPLEPDPRTLEQACVSDIDVDPQVQRELDQEQVERFAVGFDWRKVEAPTCSRQANGRKRATEGQHRIEGLKRRDPNALIWVFIVPGEATVSDDAELALAIARSRKPHSAYERWRLNVNRKQPHELAAEAVLRICKLRVGKSGTATSLACVGTLDILIHGRRRTPEQGADLLHQIIVVLLYAYPTPESPTQKTENDIARWDARLVKALGAVIERNPHLELERLANVIRGRTASQWINEGVSTSEKRVWYQIGGIMMGRYNRGLRNEERKLRW